MSSPRPLPPTSTSAVPTPRYLVASAALLSCALAWAYWPTLTAVVRRWSTDPQYSHGFLVPVFSLALLWLRRKRLAANAARVNGWGLAVLAAAAALRFVGAYVYFEWPDTLALLASIAGIVVLLGGWGIWRWAWPAVAFLGFMLPLPFQLEVALSQPLQRLATGASTYCLQTLGLPALSEGNIILIDDHKIGVLEACNGLGMLVAFFALATAVAVVSGGPVGEKVVLVLSAVPIALAMNVVRITATGVLYRTAGEQLAQAVFHDLAGWLMMPLALACLWLELKLLASLFIVARPTGPVPVVVARTPLSPTPTG